MNTSRRCSSRVSRHSGFSLLEVLISIVVTSVGLLGLAGMQATGLRNNHSAYHNSQATVLAYDMADRMRANTSAIDNYLNPPAGATPVAGCETSGGCTAAEMAQNDLFNWNTDLTTAIPGAIGTITSTVEVATIFGEVINVTTYTVDVRWDGNRSGAVDDDDPNFQVAFQP